MTKFLKLGSNCNRKRNSWLTLKQCPGSWSPSAMKYIQMNSFRKKLIIITQKCWEVCMTTQRFSRSQKSWTTSYSVELIFWIVSTTIRSSSSSVNCYIHLTCSWSPRNSVERGTAPLWRNKLQVMNFNKNLNKIECKMRVEKSKIKWRMRSKNNFTDYLFLFIQ